MFNRWFICIFIVFPLTACDSIDNIKEYRALYEWREFTHSRLQHHDEPITKQYLDQIIADKQYLTHEQYNLLWEQCRSSRNALHQCLQYADDRFPYLSIYYIFAEITTIWIPNLSNIFRPWISQGVIPNLPHFTFSDRLSAGSILSQFEQWWSNVIRICKPYRPITAFDRPQSLLIPHFWSLKQVWDEHDKYLLVLRQVYDIIINWEKDVYAWSNDLAMLDIEVPQNPITLMTGDIIAICEQNPYIDTPISMKPYEKQISMTMYSIKVTTAIRNFVNQYRLEISSMLQKVSYETHATLLRHLTAFLIVSEGDYNDVLSELTTLCYLDKASLLICEIIANKMSQHNSLLFIALSTRKVDDLIHHALPTLCKFNTNMALDVRGFNTYLVNLYKDCTRWFQMERPQVLEDWVDVFTLDVSDETFYYRLQGPTEVSRALGHVDGRNDLARIWMQVIVYLVINYPTFERNLEFFLEKFQENNTYKYLPLIEQMKLITDYCTRLTHITKTQLTQLNNYYNGNTKGNIQIIQDILSVKSKSFLHKGINFKYKDIPPEILLRITFDDLGTITINNDVITGERRTFWRTLTEKR